MAYMEVGLILARVLWSFDVQLAPGCHDWDDQRAFLIWDKGPLLVRLKQRDWYLSFFEVQLSDTKESYWCSCTVLRMRGM